MKNPEWYFEGGDLPLNAIVEKKETGSILRIDKVKRHNYGHYICDGLISFFKGDTISVHFFEENVKLKFKCKCNRFKNTLC